MDPFVSDVKKIRKRAKNQIEKGAVTQGYQADAGQVCKVLNEALATELVCVLRYNCTTSQPRESTPKALRPSSFSMPMTSNSMPTKSPSASRSSTASQT